MKKSLLTCILGICVMLTGCGAATTQTENASTSNSVIETEQLTETESVEESEPDSDTSSEVSITTERVAGEHQIEGTNITFTYEYDQPTVSIPGNETAQSTVQDELQKYIDTFINDFSGDYATLDVNNVEYSKYLTVNVMRADAQIISIQITCEGYEGGAHGYTNIAYFNYYTKSGERVTFDSLGSNFRQKAKELVLAKAKEMQEKDQIFFEEYEDSIPLVVLDGTEVSTDVYTEVYGEGDWGDSYLMTPTFYINDTGFGFTSGQYVLQPYAAGIVDFNFSAADFGDALEADIFSTEFAETLGTETAGITKAEFESFEGKTEIAEFGTFDDFNQTLSYDFNGTWYDESLGEALRITDEGAYVYIPYLDLYGNEAYEWELIDRSADGLCPELDIYYAGRGVGALAYYVAGVRDTYFWCNGQSQIFVRQN